LLSTGTNDCVHTSSSAASQNSGAHPSKIPWNGLNLCSLGSSLQSAFKKKPQTSADHKATGRIAKLR
jgi:hypothetical protein